MGLASIAVSARVASQTPVAHSADPYLWLEDVHGTRAMNWVRTENAKTVAVLERDPHYATLYAQALAIAQAKDRIPAPRLLRGDVWNFWQDADHVRGIRRHTSLADYGNPNPAWHTALDLDSLAKAEHANWVWEDATCEEPSQWRCMIALSDGGEDAQTLREFDLETGTFVPGGFALPRGKQDAVWQDDSTLLVAREWEPGLLTKSGYPFVVKRLKRGQTLSHAVEVFRGAATDVSTDPVALDDGEGHSALVVSRSVSFFESERYLVGGRAVARLALPLKAQIVALVSDQLIVKVAQDWDASQRVHIPQGSVVSIDLAAAHADPQHLEPTIIYGPGPRETFNEAAATRDALLVATLDNVRGRAWVYRRERDGHWTRHQLMLPDNAAIDIVDADLHGDHAFLSVSGRLAAAADDAAGCESRLVDDREGPARALRRVSGYSRAV